jgi:hypothetical protein
VALRQHSAPRSSPARPFDSPTPGKTESGNLKAERLSDHIDREAFSAFDFQLSAFLDAPGCCFALEKSMTPPTFYFAVGARPRPRDVLVAMLAGQRHFLAPAGSFADLSLEELDEMGWTGMDWYSVDSAAIAAEQAEARDFLQHYYYLDNLVSAQPEVFAEVLALLTEAVARLETPPPTST